MSGLELLIPAIGSAISSGVSAVGGVGSALGIAGTGLSAIGTLAAGGAANASAKATAQQMEAEAKTERAKGQRQAFEQRRQANLISSRAQAVASASGAGAGSDAPSVVKIMSDIAGQGEMNAGTAMWNGEENARSLEYGAKVKRAEGKSSFIGSVLGAGAQLGTGFAKYR